MTAALTARDMSVHFGGVQALIDVELEVPEGSLVGLIATSGVIPHIFEAELGISGTWTLLVAGITLILNLVLFPDGVAGSRYQKKKAAGARSTSAPTAGDERPAMAGTASER